MFRPRFETGTSCFGLDWARSPFDTITNLLYLYIKLELLLSRYIFDVTCILHQAR